MRTLLEVSAAIAFSKDSLEALRVALGLNQIDLVAHSMGGYLATHYALTNPDRVRRLVLVSPAGWAPKPEGPLAKGRAGGVFGALWDCGLANFGLLRTVGRLGKNAAKNVMINRLGIRDD